LQGSGGGKRRRHRRRRDRVSGAFYASCTFSPLKNKPFEINVVSHEISYRKLFCPQKHGVADRD
jgi:hypothetical protein